MPHAISAWLGRLVARIRQAGVNRDNEIAAYHGWHVQQIGPVTWSYRDPRFDQLSIAAEKAGRRSS